MVLTKLISDALGLLTWQDWIVIAGATILFAVWAFVPGAMAAKDRRDRGYPSR